MGSLARGMDIYSKFSRPTKNSPCDSVDSFKEPRRLPGLGMGQVVPHRHVVFLQHLGEHSNLNEGIPGSYEQRNRILDTIRNTSMQPSQKDGSLQRQTDFGISRKTSSSCI